MTHTKGKILYRGFELATERHMGWGDCFIYGAACYLHGKREGYDNVDIVFPRFDYERQRWNYDDKYRVNQKSGYLPWNFLPNDRVPNLDGYDRIVNTLERDSLYIGYPGILRTARNMYKYHDIYYKQTGKFPYLDIKRDDIYTPYILIQYRESYIGAHSEQRVTDIEEFKFLYSIMKERYGDKFKILKIGEPSPIDDTLDNVIPFMLDDFDSFIRLIRNSSLVISAHSCPGSIATHFNDIPVIKYGMIPVADPMNRNTWMRETGVDSYNITHHPMWAQGRLLNINKKYMLSKEEIINFLEKNNM